MSVRNRIEDLGRLLEKADQILDKWPQYPESEDIFIDYFGSPKDDIYQERLSYLHDQLTGLKVSVIEILKIAQGEDYLNGHASHKV